LFFHPKQKPRRRGGLRHLPPKKSFTGQILRKADN